MYAVGEVVLLEWQGWLKAFRVVEVIDNPDDVEPCEHCREVEYRLEMVGAEEDPGVGWIKP